MKSAAIITGSNGQDGRYLFTFLHERGYDICKYQGDVLDKESLKEVIHKYSNVDKLEIYNLAAKVDVGVSIPNPIRSFHINPIKSKFIWNTYFRIFFNILKSIFEI